MYTSHSCCNVYNIPSHLSKAPVDPSSPKDTVLTLRLWFLATTQPVQLIMTNTFSSAISCSDVSFCTKWVARSTVQSGLCLERNLLEKTLSDVSQCHFFSCPLHASIAYLQHERLWCEERERRRHTVDDSRVLGFPVLLK